MSKKDGLNIILQEMPTDPLLVCLREHHLKTQEITKVCLNNYKIATSFCREGVSEGDVCIMTKHEVQFTNIDLVKFCKERIFEICATELNSKMK
jgi:uncharacterized membrane protein